MCVFPLGSYGELFLKKEGKEPVIVTYMSGLYNLSSDWNMRCTLRIITHHLINYLFTRKLMTQ